MKESRHTAERPLFSQMLYVGAFNSRFVKIDPVTGKATPWVSELAEGFPLCTTFIEGNSSLALVGTTSRTCRTKNLKKSHTHSLTQMTVLIDRHSGDVKWATASNSTSSCVAAASGVAFASGPLSSSFVLSGFAL